MLNSFLRCPQNNNLESVHHIFNAKKQTVLYVKQPKKREGRELLLFQLLQTTVHVPCQYEVNDKSLANSVCVR